MQFALEVLDDSVNKLISNGEFAICTPFADGDAGNLSVGALVVVERQRGDLTERSIRRVKTIGARLELQSYSTDTRYAETVESPSRRKDEAVSVVARVVGKYAAL